MRLSEEQKLRVMEAIAANPRAAGYATEVWTLPRVAKLIEKQTGDRYHPGHVWWLLRELGLSCQQRIAAGKQGMRPSAQLLSARTSATMSATRWPRSTVPSGSRTSTGSAVSGRVKPASRERVKTSHL